MPSLHIRNILNAWLKSGFLSIVVLLSVSPVMSAWAEDGDVVLNNFSDKAGIRPVIFPHWLHRMRYRCRLCHVDLGFAMKAGKSEINMRKNLDGQYCGACHNGTQAFSQSDEAACAKCHKGAGTEEVTIEEKIEEGAPEVIIEEKSEEEATETK